MSDDPRGAPWFAHVDPPGDWLDQAACRGAGNTKFFPTVGDRRAYLDAVAVCETCPVRQPCLDYAVANRIRFGVWGGLNEDRRRALARTGRPRRPTTGHGVAARYQAGCHCAECREAHRIQSARYRDAARQRSGKTLTAAQQALVAR